MSVAAMSSEVDSFVEWSPTLAWNAEDVVRKEVTETQLAERLTAADGQDATMINLRSAASIVQERREPRWLLHKVLEQRALAVLAGPRGTFKSFVALDWCMRAALAGHPALLLSGEGGGLDRRIDAWMRSHAPQADLASIPLYAVEQPLDLTSAEVIESLQAGIEVLGRAPSLVLIDTFSKFSPGLDENDNAEVAQYLFRLSKGLRDRYECTVLIVAHSGHGDAKRPRGASTLMANPDAEYIIERPDPVGMLVTISRERFKDTASLSPLAYTAREVDLGRLDSYGESVTSLVLDATEPPPTKPKGTWGRNQLSTLTALKEWSRVHTGERHIATPDLYSLLKAQGIGAKRRHEVTDSLVNARILTPSIGGWTFDPDAM